MVLLANDMIIWTNVPIFFLTRKNKYRMFFGGILLSDIEMEVIRVLFLFKFDGCDNGGSLQRQSNLIGMLSNILDIREWYVTKKN